MSRRLTILCAGAYGIKNAGDDLPLICLKDQMSLLLPDHDLQFRALSRHPDPWEEKRYGVTMVKNLEHDSSLEAIGRKFLGFNDGDDSSHLERIKQEIASCDLLVLGAGNALLDQTIGDMHGPIPLMALYGSLAGQARKPLMLYGMSIGPLATPLGRHLTEGLLRTAAVITVRDAPSYKLCKELLGQERLKPDDRMPLIHVLPDAVLGARPPAAGDGRRVLEAEGLFPPADRPLLALGLRDLTRIAGNAVQDRLEQAVLGMITTLRHEVAFLFVSQSNYAEDDDRVLANRLAAAAERDAVCMVAQKRHHPQDLIALYGVADGTIAVRLHAAVFSAVAGVPSVGVNYLPKVGGFLRIMGEREKTLELDDLSATRLAAEARQLMAMTAEKRWELTERVAALGEHAEMHARLAITKGLGIGLGRDALPDQELGP